MGWQDCLMSEMPSECMTVQSLSNPLKFKQGPPVPPVPPSTPVQPTDMPYYNQAQSGYVCPNVSDHDSLANVRKTSLSNLCSSRKD